jgi:hypothetical protein
MKKVLKEVAPVSARSIVPDVGEDSAGGFMSLDQLLERQRVRDT